MGGSYGRTDGKWWKANKAKTLVGETVSDALKNYEKAEKERAENPFPEQMRQTEASLTKLSQAIVATKKKCNTTLHKETIGYLGDLDKMAVKKQHLIDADYKSMKSWLKAIETHLSDTQAAWVGFKGKLTTAEPKDFAPYLKEVKALQKVVETVAQARFFGPPLGQLDQKVRGLADVAPKAAPLIGEKPMSAKLKGVLSELDKGDGNMRAWFDKMKAGEQ